MTYVIAVCAVVMISCMIGSLTGLGMYDGRVGSSLGMAEYL